MDRDKLEELIKIRANKTFSPVEKAMEKAMKMDDPVTSSQTAPSPQLGQTQVQPQSAQSQSSQDEQSSPKVNAV
jgi:hypothetical protein